MCVTVSFAAGTKENQTSGAAPSLEQGMADPARVPPLVLLIVVHIIFIRLHGVTELKFEDEPSGKQEHFNFFPDHMLTELMLGLMLMIVLSALATVFPAAMGPKADPLTTPEVIKPEWFFYMMFRWLKLFSGTTAVLSTGFIIFRLAICPPMLFSDGGLACEGDIVEERSTLAHRT